MTALAAADRAERFTIRLGSATSLASLIDWFENAAAGDQAIYASGFTCPREHESVKQARAWAEAGLVHLAQRRDPDDRRHWHYTIQKASKPQRVTARPARKVKPDLTREQMRCLMKMLRKAAAEGALCPSYAEMGAHLALGADRRARERARYLIDRLIKERKINVTPGSATLRPVVTIIAPGRAKGKSTKGPDQ